VTDGDLVVARLLDTVDYLRVSVGEAPADADWLAATRLVGDPAYLRAVVRSTARGRGTDQDDVALSLFTQGYAFRIASVAIGAWLISGDVLDVAPSRVHIALGRDRPNAVLLDQASLMGVAKGEALAQLHRTLIDGHLAPLVDTARSACRIGEALLWANVAAACASSFGAFMAPWPDRHRAIADQFEAFLATAEPEVRRGGRVVHIGTGWAWERSACCLWYQTESGFKCEDCSLWTDEERRARYVALVEPDGG
jgi:ferric iron reductase protein FhuF